MSVKLTTRQAFNAMRRFLENHYKRTSSNDIGSLLGDISFLQDYSTADPAAWEEWIDCVEKVLEGKNEEMEGRLQLRKE